MIDAIKKRRSVREYLAESIPEEKIQEIIKAAMYAPSARALYPWDLVVIREAETKELLAKVTPWSTHAKDADAIIVVVGQEKESPNWIEDGTIAAEHIWLEATEQGLASCWIQVRGHENAEKSVKEILNIPEDHRVLCLMPLGVPAKLEEEHSEDDFDKKRIKYEKYK